MRLFLSSILIVLLALVATPGFADVTKACQVVGTEFDPTEAGATDNFISLQKGDMSTTETVVDKYVAPVELIVSDITAFVDVAPGANDSYVIYFSADATRVPGLTCTISDTGKDCNTGGDNAVIAVGSRITLVVDTSEGAGDPAAAASLEVSACVRRS